MRTPKFRIGGYAAAFLACLLMLMCLSCLGALWLMGVKIHPEGLAPASIIMLGFLFLCKVVEWLELSMIRDKQKTEEDRKVLHSGTEGVRL